MKNFHRFLERTGLPVLIVVLIPLVAVLYLFSGASQNTTVPATSVPTAPTTQQQSTTNAEPPATISLNDPSSLPQSVSAAQLVPFSFTVQNTSNQSATYQYKVSVQWSTGEQDVVDENVLSIAAGASSVVQEQLKFEIATETAEVIFSLPQTDQSLQFALPASK